MVLDQLQFTHRKFQIKRDSILTRNNPRKTRFVFFIKPGYLDERQLPTEKEDEKLISFFPRPVPF